ncbi:hypothetical protein BOX15_Mlig002866g1, partial [Macrostomum lignano]
PITSGPAAVAMKGGTRVVHDFHFNRSTPSCNLYLALQQSKSLVAVAGRTVFKIFRLDECRDEPAGGYSLSDMHILPNNYQRKSKQNLSGLDTAIADIVWSPSDESKLAWGSTNNKVFVLDINKEKYRMFQCHSRSVNCVVFHPSTPLLLSSSNDGSVFCYDLRSPETEAVACANFSTGGDNAVRCIDFSRVNENLFATGQESGTIQVWDIRNTQKPERSFHAQHSVITCSWHPNSQFNWLATGCHRQNTIGILDFSSTHFTAVRHLDTIQCISPVLKVRWRPDCDMHIASTAKTCDKNIYVWDLASHYLPDRIFEEHTGDMVTGFDWVGPDWLLSVGKDGRIILHHYSDGYRPADWVNPCSLAVSCRGSLAASQSTKKLPADPNVLSVQLMQLQTQPPPPQQQQPALGRNFSLTNAVGVSGAGARHRGSAASASSAVTATIVQWNRTSTPGEYNLVEYRCPSQKLPLGTDSFVHLAKHYRLSGASLSEVCAHNFQLAAGLGLDSAACLWQLVLCAFGVEEEALAAASAANAASAAEASASLNLPEHQLVADELAGGGGINSASMSVTSASASAPANMPNSESVSALLSLDDVDADRRLGLGGSAGGGGGSSSGGFAFIDAGLQSDSATLDDDFDGGGAGAGVGGDTDVGELDAASAGGFGDASSKEPNDYLFSDGEPATADEEFFADGTGTGAAPLEQSQLPLQGLWQQKPQQAQQHRKRRQQRSGSWQLLQQQQQQQQQQPPQHQQEFLPSDLPPLTAKLEADLSGMVTDAMYELVNCGHVQTVATACVLLGDRLRDKLDESVAETWMLSYIDLLHSHQLFVESAALIGACGFLPNVALLNQQSTSISLICAACNYPSKQGFTCARSLCKQRPLLCVICHRTVRGLYLWSRACQHGGHFDHLMDWYSKNSVCPECGASVDFGI